MLRVALREIRSHGVRFALSVLAVVLGVAFVAGTFNLRDMLAQAFDAIVASSVQGDVYVRGVQDDASDDSGGGPLGGGEAREAVDIGIADRLDDVAGVAVALPDVQGPTVLVGSDGTAVINGQAPSIGIGLSPDDPSVRMVQGRAPTSDDEIAVEASALRAAGLAVGDTTSIVLDDVREVTVVGEAELDTPTVGATLIFLPPSLAEASFAPDGRVSRIAVYAADGTSTDRLETDVRAALSGTSGVEVVSGDALREEASEAIEAVIGFIGTFLLVFAAIALFVGAFIIGNTFAMSVRQRQREYALLRAVGASPAQVFGVVIAQAAAVGVVGSGLGFLAGTGLVHAIGAVLARLGMALGEPPPPDPRVLAWCLAAGTVVSVVAAVLPARRAALTAPVEAMRDDVTVTDRSLRGRAVVGGLLLAGGTAAVVQSVRGVDDAAWWLGAGAAGVLLGTLAIAPVVARAVLRVLALPFLLLQPLGRLARGNVTRNPRRTATTAGALMIGMALVAACTVLASSATASTTAVVDGETRADLIVQSATGSIPADALTAVADLDGAARVDAVQTARMEVTGPDGDTVTTTVTGVPPEAIGDTLRIRGLLGDPGELAAGTAIIGDGAARDRGWDLGDDIDLDGDGGQVRVRVVAVTDSQLLSTDVVVSAEDLAALAPADTRQTTVALVTAAPGTAVPDLQDDATAAVAPFVTVAVLTPTEFTDRLADQVEQALVIIYALLGLSVVIAVMGIVNTLALSVIERTREIGLVRAVGLGRLQLSVTIVIESVLTAVFGTALGLVVGVGLAAALQSVYADEGLTVLDVPVPQLGAILMLSAVVGVVAAVWPAIRASRLPVLEAIAQE